MLLKLTRFAISKNIFVLSVHYVLHFKARLHKMLDVGIISCNIRWQIINYLSVLTSGSTIHFRRAPLKQLSHFFTERSCFFLIGELSLEKQRSSYYTSSVHLTLKESMHTFDDIWNMYNRTYIKKLTKIFFILMHQKLWFSKPVQHFCFTMTVKYNEAKTFQFQIRFLFDY